MKNLDKGLYNKSNLICATMYLLIIISTPAISYMSFFGHSYGSMQQQASANTTVTFAAAGAWGCNSDTQNTVNSIASKIPDLVLGLGDYSYDETEDC